MKRKLTLVLIAGGTICILLILISAIRDAKLMAWTDATEAGIKHLAQALEIYRDDHGSYPPSLEALLSGTKPEIRDYIHRNRILHDQWHDNYQYQRLTNGFVLVVTAQGGWFLKGRRVEKTFRIGEALE